MTSVNGIMNQENRTRNTAVGAGVGAVAGAGVGYLTKQVVKDNSLTSDVFQKTVKNIEIADKASLEPFKNVDELAEVAKKARGAVGELAENATEEAKTAHQVLEDTANKAETALFEAKKAIVGADVEDNKVEEVFNATRQNAEASITKTTNIALADSKVAKDLKEIVKEGEETSIDDMKKVIKSFGDSKFEIENLDKKTMSEALEDDSKVKGFFEQIQGAVKAGEDNKKAISDSIEKAEIINGKKIAKEFKEGSEKLGNAVKKAVKSAKFKQAAIVGAISAAVIGAGAHLLSNKKADK